MQIIRKYKWSYKVVVMPPTHDKLKILVIYQLYHVQLEHKDSLII